MTLDKTKLTTEEKQKVRMALVEASEKEMGRPMLPNEIVNMENDALLLARHALELTAELGRRVAILEGNK